MKSKTPAVIKTVLCALTAGIILCALIAGISRLVAAPPMVAQPVGGKAAAVAAVLPAGWKTITPKGAGFSLALPSEPTRMMDEEMERKTGLVTYRLENDGFYYDISYFSISGVGKLWGIQKEMPMQEVFTKVISNFSGPDSTETKVSDQKDAPLQGRRGSEGTFTLVKGKEASRSRMVIDGDRLVMVSVTAPTAAALSNPKVGTFLNSLKFSQEDAPNERVPAPKNDAPGSLPMGWESNGVKGTGFTFALPNALNASFELKENTYNFPATADGITYLVFFPSDAATGVMDTKRAQRLIDAKVALYGKRGNISERQDALFQGRPGSKFTLTTASTTKPTPTTSLIRMVMVNGRLVTMIAKAPTATELSSPEVALFFNSLKFAEWDTYSDSDMGITYILPITLGGEAPLPLDQDLQLEGGDMFSFVGAAAGITYSVSYPEDAATGAVDTKRAQRLIDAKVALYGKRGKISERQDALFQGHPGSKFTLTTAATTEAKPTTTLIRMVMANDGRLVTMSARAPSATKLSSPTVAFFFNGFKVTAKNAEAAKQ